MRRRRWLVLGVVVLLVALPGAAVAYLMTSSTATTSITATAATVPAGAQPAASVLGRNVELRWAPSRFGDGTAMTSYALAGVGPLGVAPVAATCGGSVLGDGLVGACGVSRLAPGTWQFTVTPSFGSWVGAASPGRSVVVPAPSLTASPSTVAAGGVVVARTVAFLDGQTVTMRWGSATGPVLGSVVTAGDGTSSVSVTVPATAVNGTFSLVAVGDQGDTASLLIKVANKPRNTAPVAVDDSRLTVGSTSIAVLANDTDADGDPLVVVAVGKARNGFTAVEPGGTGVRYSAFSGYRGDDSFTYDISDGHGGTARATVRVASGGLGLRGTFGLAPYNTLTIGGGIDGLADPTAPISMRTTSPVPGPFEAIIVGPVSALGGGRMPGWVLGGQNVRASASVLTSASPYVVFFRVEGPAVGAAVKVKKPVAPAPTTEVLFDGVAVPACVAVVGVVADPDPCVVSNRYDAVSNDYLVSVRARAVG